MNMAQNSNELYTVLPNVKKGVREERGQNNLQLSLKKKWFELTKKGIKTEDYRDITPYWCSRLLMQNGKKETQDYWKQYLDIYGVEVLKVVFDNKDNIHRIKSKNILINKMTLGYPKSTDTNRIIKLEHKGLDIRTGNENWGAEPGKLYFVIKHGKPTE